MGRTAGQAARVGVAERPSSTGSPVRRPAAECHTVREILPPWHVLQDKLQKRSDAIATGSLVPADQAAREALAAQEAANEQWMPVSDSDAPPSSGVRVSDPGPESSALSFKVYTLAELERRSDAPVAMRTSRASFDTTGAREAERWQRLFTALRGFAVASLAWWKTPGPRPSPKVALRQPFDVLGDELQVVVESIDWKKHGVTTGIVVGASLTLLFGVLTAAELTDDLKPAAHLASRETSVLEAKVLPGARGVAPATNMAAMGVQPVSPSPSALLPPEAAAAATSIGEIDDPEPAPVAPKRAAAKKAKPKPTKLSFRNPDAVFNP